MSTPFMRFIKRSTRNPRKIQRNKSSQKSRKKLLSKTMFRISRSRTNYIDKI